MPGDPRMAPPGSDESSALGQRRLVLFGALLVYAALAVVAYLPTLPLDGSHTQMCTCGDTAQGIWFLAWVPFALSHGHSLFYSNWVLYPAGVNLADNTAMTLLGLAAAPITVLAGPVAAYNLMLRAAFALSSLAMFVTVRRLVRWWPTAFLAGLVYGFSPFMAAQGLSHEFLVFAPIPPLVFGIVTDVLGRRRRTPRQAGLLLGLLFAAQFLVAAEVFVMLALLTVVGAAVALCYRHARVGARHLVQTAAWAAGVCAIVIAYPVYFFAAGRRHLIGPPHPLTPLYAYHGDVLGALLPTPLMRFAPAGWLRAGAALVAHNLQENGTYLGLPLVAVAAGLAVAFRRRPVTAVCGVLAVVSYALSLGSRIYLANRPTAIPGPFAVLAHLPVLKNIEPVRFSLFTVLFVAIVLGTGLDQLRSAVYVAPVMRASGEAATQLHPTSGAPPGRTAASRLRWLTAARGAVLVAAVGIAALLPLVPRWPYPVGPVVTPPFFTSSAVKQIPPGAVVATLPYPVLQFNEAMVWQAETSMRFRLLGGSAFFVPGPGGRGRNSSRVRLHPLGIEKVFRRALHSRPDAGRPLVLRPGLVTAVRADLRRYHVGAVIIDPLVDREAGMGFSYPGGIRTLTAPPGLDSAVRYITAATGRPPQSLGGVLAWFHLADRLPARVAACQCDGPGHRFP